MTSAEIAQTKRMLIVARRNYVHYAMKVSSYQQRQLDVPYGMLMGMQENDLAVKQYESELIAAGVEVES